MACVEIAMVVLHHWVTDWDSFEPDAGLRDRSAMWTLMSASAGPTTALQTALASTP